jgi:hypothetical protein
MLARKLAAARCSLEDLIQYANGLDPTLGGSYRKAAEGALEALATIPNGSSENLYQRLYGELREITEDPTTFSMVQLYWFFRSGCGLTGDESEVRVAIIRNELWIRSEVSKVDFIPAYQGDQSQGCQAVHEAVRRFRP